MRYESKTRGELIALVKVLRKKAADLERIRLRRSKLEDTLFNIRTDLEVRIQRRTFELSRANIELKEEVEKRKVAQENCEELQRQIEFILGATKTGLDIIDQDLNIRFIDPQWAKVYGDPKGKKCYEYFMDKDKACAECGVRKALETKSTIVTYEVLKKENNRPIEVITMPFQNKSGEWLVAEINIDISERLKIENELRDRIAELERATPKRGKEKPRLRSKNKKCQ